jgi:hypothetical protein
MGSLPVGSVEAHGQHTVNSRYLGFVCDERGCGVTVLSHLLLCEAVSGMHWDEVARDWGSDLIR